MRGRFTGGWDPIPLRFSIVLSGRHCGHFAEYLYKKEMNFEVILKTIQLQSCHIVV